MITVQPPGSAQFGNPYENESFDPVVFRNLPNVGRTKVMRCSQPFLTIVNYEVTQQNFQGEGSVLRGNVTARVRCALCALPFLLASSWAQSAGPISSDQPQETITQLVEQIKQLQQQDQDLQARIATLEGRQPQGTTEAKADSSSASAAQQSVGQTAPPTLPDVSRDWHDVHGIQWRGFGEVNYRVLNQRQPELGTGGFTPGSAGNFYIEDFGLFLTSRLTEKASVLSEIIFQEGEAQSFTVDLRRMLLKYDYNDHFKFSFGRYQTSIGYYNWAFRSAAWLQTTTDRPLIMEFASNGGLLPTQAVGVSITGAIPSGKLGLNYVAEYGSSDTIRPDIHGDGEVDDERNGNHVNVGIFLRPDPLPGLQIGASYYHDKISNSVQGPSLRYGRSIVNGYVVYVAHGVEFLNEGFFVRHSALHFSNAVFDTPAFYSQISKQLGHIRPFFRYQYVNADTDNLNYDDIRLREGPSFGARYDWNSYIAFTAQLDHTIRRGEPDLNGLQLQIAFTF